MTDQTDQTDRQTEQTEQAEQAEAGPGKPKHLRRFQVVNRLLSLYDAPRYLEVGVCRGLTFDRARAAVKVAVDPEFVGFSPADREAPGVRYHEVTSDEYFGSIVGEDELFDVIYLDGLHTVEQTLRDLLNALEHLEPDGVILIDDVRPPTHLASLPDRQEFFEERRRLGSTAKAWMGDVYRLMYFIDTFMPHLSYRTVSNNHGQAVVWRRRRAQVTDRPLRDVATVSFADFEKEQDDVLRPAPMWRIMRQLRTDLGLG